MENNFSPEHCHEGQEEDGAGTIHEGEGEDQREERHAVFPAADRHRLVPEEDEQDGGYDANKEQEVNARRLRYPVVTE